MEAHEKMLLDDALKSAISAEYRNVKLQRIICASVALNVILGVLCAVLCVV